MLGVQLGSRDAELGLALKSNARERLEEFAAYISLVLGQDSCIGRMANGCEAGEYAVVREVDEQAHCSRRKTPSSWAVEC